MQNTPNSLLNIFLAVQTQRQPTQLIQYSLVSVCVCVCVSVYTVTYSLARKIHKFQMDLSELLGNAIADVIVNTFSVR